MARMLLVNPALPPSKRKRKPTKAKPAKRSKPMAKRKRSAAQKAATRRLVAANRARRSPRRSRNPIMSFGSRPAANAFRARPRRRRNPIMSFGSRPAANAFRARRRRNPVSGGKMRVMDLLKQASLAATGALVLDAAWSYLPIPAAINVGGVKHVAKGAGAVIMGMLLSKVTNKRTAENMTLGALTVIVHSAAREILTTAVPSLRMDGLGYYSPGMVVNGMGEYLTAPRANMGEYMSMDMSADQRAMAMDGMNYYG